jgi:hypothetical protein
MALRKQTFAPGPSDIFIKRYFDMRMYKKLGIVTDVVSLYDFEIDAFSIIETAIADYEAEEMKKARSKKR